MSPSMAEAGRLNVPSPAASRSTSPNRDDGYGSSSSRSGSPSPLLRKQEHDPQAKPMSKHFYQRTSPLKLAIIFLTLATLILLSVVLGIKVGSHSDRSDTPPAEFAAIAYNFADPCIIQRPDTDGYVAYATRSLDHRFHIPFATTSSNNLTNFVSADADAFPELPEWVAKRDDTQVWAPSVAFTPNISTTNQPGFVLFYSALHRDHPQRHCIGSATSSSITGPFTPTDEPLVCDFEYGGVIDPSYFFDPITKSSWLTYKRDGNAIGVGGACGNTALVPETGRNRETPIMAVELDRDISKVKPNGISRLLVNNEVTDGANLESPVLFFHKTDNAGGTGGGVYHLLMNAGCFHDSSYRIDHAYCVASAGGLADCTWKRTANPLLSSGDVLTSTLPNTNGKGTQSVLITSPGGPGVTNPTSFHAAGTNHTGGEYLIFHMELNEGWYGHERVPYEESVEKGWDRRRGMMVAEIRYEGDGTGLRVGRVIAPEGRGGGASGRERGELMST
jgi:hypothetical protein